MSKFIDLIPNHKKLYGFHNVCLHISKNIIIIRCYLIPRKNSMYLKAKIHQNKIIDIVSCNLYDTKIYLAEHNNKIIDIFKHYADLEFKNFYYEKILKSKYFLPKLYEHFFVELDSYLFENKPKKFELNETLILNLFLFTHLVEYLKTKSRMQMVLKDLVETNMIIKF